jgi:FKBP-type peptidyl-prolyl cis-trans isomerase FkpA
MLQKAKFFIPVLAGLFLMQGCQDKKKNDEFTKGEGTLEYKIFAKGKDGKYERKEVDAAAKTDTSKVGKVIMLHQIVKNDKDSVLYTSYKSKFPVMDMLRPSTYKGSMEQAMLMLNPGDSAVFRIDADTLFAKSFNSPLPPFLKKGSKVTYFVKVDKIITREEAMVEQQKLQEEMQKEMMAHSEKQASVDDENIQKYLKENNLTAQKTESGLYYIITQKGSGPTPKAGQIVAVQYRGTTLDGKEFDSSAKHGGTPFEFQVGQGQVIRGWDEGLMLLNKGSKAILLIPSVLAYGQQGAGADIPADASLRFDIEVVDIK